MWSVQMWIPTLRLHTANLLEVMRSTEHSSPICHLSDSPLHRSTSLADADFAAFTWNPVDNAILLTGSTADDRYFLPMELKKGFVTGRLHALKSTWQSGWLKRSRDLHDSLLVQPGKTGWPEYVVRSRNVAIHICSNHIVRQTILIIFGKKAGDLFKFWGRSFTLAKFLWNRWNGT